MLRVRSPLRGGRPRWAGLLSARPLALLGVVGAAGALRLVDLGQPRRIFFDESYYATDAREYLARGVEAVRAVHPPLGKWAIAAGIEVLGFDPWGWRIAPALAGTATVALVFLAARRLFAGTAAAVLAGGLVAVDGLSHTMSRIAMLDAFLALFVTAAFWATVAEVDEVLDPAHHERRAGSWWARRRWWLVIGVALGCAVATKWSGALVGPPAVGAVVVAHLVAARRCAPSDRPTRRVLARGAGATLACFAVVPAVVYVGSYAGWFANYPHTTPGERRCGDEVDCDPSAGVIAGDWFDEQVDISRRHRSLEPTHPYRSEPHTWVVGTRPVLMYLERCRDGEPDDRPCDVAPGDDARIVGLPNPVLWWAALAAYPVVLWRALRRRRRSSLLVAAFYAGLYLPWFASPIPGFLFYMTPVAPFVALSVVDAVSALRRPRLRVALGALVLVAAVGAFAWLYPVLSGTAISERGVDVRLSVDSWR